MKSGIHKILLPVTVDQTFEKAAKFAFNLCRVTGGSVTALAVDDDSPRHETTLLPFHTKNLVCNVQKSEQSSIPAVNEKIKWLHSLAADTKSTFDEMLLSGHTATQILLASRFHDIVVLPDAPSFADLHGGGPRRVNPLLEILDQAVVPTLLCGALAVPRLDSAALYFDGSPYASVALHQLANLYQSSPDEKIVVRVSTFDEETARQLARNASEFLKTKGLTDIETEYSPESPIDYALAHARDDINLAVLGVRSRQAYHDFRIGALAHHFIEKEPSKNKLFC